MLLTTLVASGDTGVTTTSGASDDKCGTKTFDFQLLISPGSKFRHMQTWDLSLFKSRKISLTLQTGLCILFVPTMSER